MKIIDIPQHTLELLAYQLGADEAWPEPEELRSELSPVEPFNEKLLPEVMCRFVMDIAHRMQAPPDFVATALLVSLGAVIGAGCAVRPKQRDDWSEVPNLWGGVVGGPSTMKSPTISAGCEPLKWLDSDARTEFESAQAAYISDKAERDYDIKILKSDKGFAKLGLTEEEGRARLRSLMANAPEEPKLKRFRTNDATIEVLGELLKEAPRGLLLIRDELVGLLAACQRQGHEGDRPFYLEAWNGQHPFAVDRIGRGSIVIPRLSLGIFGGIQPARLQDYLAGTLEGYDNDGLIQRFQLMVYPDEISDWHYIDEPPDNEARDDVVAIARTLEATDFVSLGATPAGDKPPFFRFCAAAQRVFIKWLTELEAEIRAIEHPIMAEHLSKYRKLVPALSLIFHLVDLANGRKFRKPGISKEALLLAIRWAVYLKSHALRIYSLGHDPVVNAANAIIRKIQSGSLTDSFSVRDVYKSGWSGLTDAELVRAACDELEQAGWIRRMPAPHGNGRPPSPSYRVNPKAISN